MNKPILVAMIGLVIFSSLNIIFNKNEDLMLVTSVGVAIAGILVAIWIWDVSRNNRMARRS